MFDKIDFSNDVKLEKVEILKKWQKELSANPEIFNLLLEICSQIEYYSAKKTADQFKTFFRNELESLDKLNNPGVYIVPYVSKEYIESASTLYILLKEVLSINKAFTKHSTENTQEFFENMQRARQKAKNYLSEQDDFNFSSKLSDDELFFASIQEIYIVDDFLGTGKSLLKFFSPKNEKLFRELDNLGVKVNMVCLAASICGKNKVQAFFNKFSNLNIINLNTLDNYYSKNSILKKEDSAFLKNYLDDWNKKEVNKNTLRFNMDLTACSYINVPNNDIPFLWYGGNNNHVPLLVRKIKKRVKPQDYNQLLNDQFRELRKKRG
ncbi:hypothetical protein FD31_GL001216 [Companilactobacillus nantensis DSM 16982]|uniref:PRTase-CE domain-containing protein n=1 Tax=Companilactobacillus nantensis DSM 16982 TaxID=1423774 RepID=A0A0R1WD09_9LACO|nr:hypothetical protein FD31_GL001216 [Companilactobacillus nantensis DSM 16982]